MYDANKKNSLEKTEKFGADILKYCVKVGGVLTGEHGVGVEKRELMCEMFSNYDIQQQIKIGPFEHQLGHMVEFRFPEQIQRTDCRKRIFSCKRFSVIVKINYVGFPEA